MSNYKQQIDRMLSHINEKRDSDEGESIQADEVFDVVKLLDKLYESDNVFFKKIAFDRLNHLEDKQKANSNKQTAKPRTDSKVSIKLLEELFGPFIKSIEPKMNTLSNPVIEGNAAAAATAGNATSAQLTPSQSNTTRIKQIGGDGSNGSSTDDTIAADAKHSNDGFGGVLVSMFSKLLPSKKSNDKDNIAFLLHDIKTTIKTSIGETNKLLTNQVKPSSESTTTTDASDANAQKPKPAFLQFFKNSSITRRLIEHPNGNTGSSNNSNNARDGSKLLPKRFKSGNTTAATDSKDSLTSQMSVVIPLLESIDGNVIRLTNNMALNSKSNAKTLFSIDSSLRQQLNKKENQKKTFDDISNSRKRLTPASNNVVNKLHGNDNESNSNNSSSSNLFGGGGLEKMIANVIMKGMTSGVSLAASAMTSAATNPYVLGAVAAVLPGNIGESGKYHTMDSLGGNGQPVSEEGQRVLDADAARMKNEEAELMKDPAYRKQVEEAKAKYEKPKEVKSSQLQQQQQPSNQLQTQSQTSKKINASEIAGDDADPVIKSILERVIHNESRGNNFDSAGNVLTSKKGAKGAMQVLPKTAQFPGYKINPARDDSVEEYNRVGVDYIKTMYKRYGGDVEKTMASYNMGPAALENVVRLYGNDWRDHIPKETRDYISYDNKSGTSKLDIASIKKGMGEDGVNNNLKSDNPQQQQPKSSNKLIATDGANESHTGMQLQLPPQLIANSSNGNGGLKETPSGTKLTPAKSALTGQGTHFVTNINNPTPVKEKPPVAQLPSIVNAPSNNVNNTTITPAPLNSRNDETTLRGILNTSLRKAFI